MWIAEAKVQPDCTKQQWEGRMIYDIGSCFRGRMFPEAGADGGVPVVQKLEFHFVYVQAFLQCFINQVIILSVSITADFTRVLHDLQSFQTVL